MTDRKDWHNWRVVALAGGVGGAKLAHGLAQILPDGHLTVIVNTADDFWLYGLRICPDLDTVMYTLAGIANPATGWGIANDTWQMLLMLDAYGEKAWFRLGDRDLATHLLRTQALAQSESLTAISQRLAGALGIKQNILPVTDEVIATVVQTEECGELDFQEYFVKYRWQPRAKAVRFVGCLDAHPTAAVCAALSGADVVIFCPSNPVLSIAPMLEIPGLRQALSERNFRCIAVSPLIGGKAIRGPADKLMGELGLESSNTGVARYYHGLIDGLVIDTGDGRDQAAFATEFPALKLLLTPTLMQSVDDRKQVAARILDWLAEDK